MSEIMTEVIAAEETAEDTMRGKYLALSLGEQQFAISIEYVVDIINVSPITPVPNCPAFVKGITNLRGKVIPIIDLRLRFGKEPKEYNDRTCIIVLEERGASVGLIVDSVSTTLDIGEEQISPPPSFSQGLDTKFIQGVGRNEHGVTLILDCKTVLDDNLMDAMDQRDEDEY